MTTLLVTHPACLDHLTPAGHPERPDRLRAIAQALEDERFRPLARSEAPAATFDTITLCHPLKHVEAIRDATPARGFVQIDADTLDIHEEGKQRISVFSGGVFRAAKNADGAGKLVAYLASPRLAPVLIRKGLEPVSPLAGAARSASDV